MQKILVTGASGFWGYNFIKYIESKKNLYQITCVYNTDIKPLEGLNVLVKIFYIKMNFFL